MPTYVDPARCDGCRGGQRTACMHICPNDLMLLDSVSIKAFNQEPDACWECYSCVKICPQGAISVRPYADFAPLGGVCLPLRGSQDIAWTVRFRNGQQKRFRFPIRTTPEDSIRHPADLAADASLDDSRLATETSLPPAPAGAVQQRFTVSDADRQRVFATHSPCEVRHER
ncbi:adenylyl-sulfate reductase subunit beta [uncultured Desulfovibrio sp.]|uniref:Adenylyl-sulfate reductase subunit beta n=1 Tax=Candidatus Desulfovibrio intestinavium TaxID=2838534 RepID=A0A9D2KRL2_9BACT|nr:adenylyl-sulfate reductase subunit beta [uncultured Desulfovibrio sp.]HJA79694.1 adenylyl-sulfate reductase subunit beta [Candidatus Desulfovibrio intestinavium]